MYYTMNTMADILLPQHQRQSKRKCNGNVVNYILYTDHLLTNTPSQTYDFILRGITLNHKWTLQPRTKGMKMQSSSYSIHIAHFLFQDEQHDRHPHYHTRHQQCWKLPFTASNHSTHSVGISSVGKYRTQPPITAPTQQISAVLETTLHSL